MAVRRIGPNQPASFAFTPENEAWAKATIAKYPPGKQASAVIPLLWRAQEQHDNWLPEPAMRLVADMLGMAHIRVYEVATFYTMFQLSPVGKKAHVQVCGTTPCMLRGAETLKEVCERRIGAKHSVSADGQFSWEEVECVGACVNAPVVAIDDYYHEDLTPDALEALIAAVYLDGGLSPAREVVMREFEPALQELTRPEMTADYKTELQERCQKEFESLPFYQVIRETGPDHQKLFEVEIRIQNTPYATATGRSKKEAEQRAAQIALDKLRKGWPPPQE